MLSFEPLYGFIAKMVVEILHGGSLLHRAAMRYTNTSISFHQANICYFTRRANMLNIIDESYQMNNQGYQCNKRNNYILGRKLISFSKFG